MFEAIYDFVKGIFNEIVEFFTELPIKVLDGILGAIASIIESIPVPDFMNVSIGDYIPDDIGWFLSVSSFPACLAIIGAGITFYFFRRILTLGIW